jgi:hypothetical protein
MTEGIADFGVQKTLDFTGYGQIVGDGAVNTTAIAGPAA